MTKRAEVFLGRYHCLERLGDGPLGETYRARVYGIGGFEKEFAVKRLHDDRARDEAFVARLARAATAAASLQCGGVARVLALESEGGLRFLVSELVRGIDLAVFTDLLRASGDRISVNEAVLISGDACDAIGYAHAKSVLHLGLSPHGVLVDAEGESRLVDVGLSAALIAPGWTKDERLADRLGFLAPEVRAGRTTDQRADVYSVGALLDALTEGAVEVEPIVRRATARDAAARYPTVAALKQALAPLVEERRAARKKLAERVARYLAPPGVDPPSEPIAGEALPINGHPKAPPPPIESIHAALDWEPNEFPRAAALDEDAITHFVKTPPRPPLDPVPTQFLPPTTLPLSALREPPRRRGRWYAAAGAGLIAGAALLALTAGRKPDARDARTHEPSPSENSRTSENSRARENPRFAEGSRVRPNARVAEDSRARENPGLNENSQARENSGVGENSRAGAIAGAADLVAPATALLPLDVASEPAGARVFVDGVERGPAPLQLGVKPGEHRVALLLDRHELARRKLTVDGTGARVVMELLPARLPVGDARLKVRCQTEGALRIFVDGADSGMTCPNAHALEVEPGHHRLELYSPSTDELISVQKELDIAPGDRSTRVYLKY